MSNVVRQLEAVVGTGGVLTGDDVSERSAGVWGPLGNIQAKAIVRPENTEEVSAVMKICHAAGQAVVAHGGLTNVVMSSLTTSEDIALSLERMRKIEEIDKIGRTMTVQSGAPLQVVQEEARKAGLLFPLDLGARGSCTIGGNIATNAGGTRVIRYGMMRQLVLGLEAVLADGTVVSSMNEMIKNNAGYDLKHLFIGTEGTLGIVTRAVLHLEEMPQSHNAAFVALNSFDKVTAFLKFIDRALGGTLSAYEVLWKDFYQLVTTEPAKADPPLPYDYPYYVLVESLGATQEEDTARFQRAMEQALEKSLLVDAVIASSQRERDAFWAMRDDVEQLFRYQPLFLFDVSLPIKNMESYLGQVQANLSESWPEHRCFVFGHLGDGNLHISVTIRKGDEATRRKVEELVYRPLQAIRGSITAEHGIGLEKKPYLSWCRSENEIALMRALKQALDPKGLLNPGKIFDFEPPR